jgi:hypothetical protein
MIGFIQTIIKPFQKTKMQQTTRTIEALKQKLKFSAECFITQLKQS